MNGQEKYEEKLLKIRETQAWDEENRPKFIEELHELLDRYGYTLTTTYIIGAPAFRDRSYDRYRLDGTEVE